MTAARVGLFAVEQGLEVMASRPRGATRALRTLRDYEVRNVSEKALRIILSHTDYVCRVVGREHV